LYEEDEDRRHDMKDIAPPGLKNRKNRARSLAPLRFAGLFLSGRLLNGSVLVLVPLLLVMRAERVGVEVETPMEENALEMAVVGSALPLHVNPRVERWVKRFRTDQRRVFLTLLERQGVYDQLIRGRLRERGMPEDLVYLAMMEGGFSPWAVSSASAVGLWQFMGPTAQEYGLRVDEWVDERRDPVKATDAALDYLLWLHDYFGSWYLAAAAYNAGPSRVERVLNRHAEGRRGEEDLYWEVLDYLPRETREYVPRMVAAALLAKDAREEGFDVQARRPFEFDLVFVPGTTSLARIARALDVDIGVIRALNPQLLRGVTPPREIYAVRVPVGDSPQVVASMGQRTIRRTD
jgi:membrane-bound lytic murein transglycosylase D